MMGGLQLAKTTDLAPASLLSAHLAAHQLCLFGLSQTPNLASAREDVSAKYFEY